MGINQKVPIPLNHQFKLKTITYENGDPILQAYVVCSQGIRMILLPKKQDGKRQEVQEVVVSPYLISRLTDGGTVIDFVDGVATTFFRHRLYYDYQVLCDFQ